MRNNKILGMWVIILSFSMLHVNCQTKQDTLKLLDFEIETITTPRTDVDNQNYSSSVSEWSTYKEVHNWVKNNFEYDFARAQLLANNSKEKGKTSIYSPEELWTKKRGICIDLSRFAFETVKIIDSTANIKYLKIEFEPVQINGSTFVNHWLIAIKVRGEYFFFADSKRPKNIDGPYQSVSNFI